MGDIQQRVPVLSLSELLLLAAGSEDFSGALTQICFVEFMHKIFLAFIKFLCLVCGPVYS